MPHLPRTAWAFPLGSEDVFRRLPESAQPRDGGIHPLGGVGRETVTDRRSRFRDTSRGHSAIVENRPS